MPIEDLLDWHKEEMKEVKKYMTMYWDYHKARLSNSLSFYL